MSITSFVTKKTKYIIPTMIVMMLANLSFATEMASSCYSLDNNLEIKGKNINERMPIASVSKLFTSYWSVTKRGLNYKFPTKIYLTPLKNGKYDLHLSGSRDPYFGKESLHFLISSLNKMNITNIETFSFDDDFKFIWNLNNPEVMWKMDYRRNSPSVSFVLSELTNHNSFIDGYSFTQELARRKGIALTKNPHFTYSSVQYISKDQFLVTPQTKVLTFYSAPLSRILKQMNKSSNNHAAGQVFESLGGAEMFNPFIQNDLSTPSKRITDSDIFFFNGSGDNFEIESGISEYNEGSCFTVVKMLKNFQTFLNKNYNKSLKEVLAVVGGDSSINGQSVNTTKYLNSSIKENSVVAKTGTVNPNITLGGMASTHDGLVFFFYNESINGRTGSPQIARMAIKKELSSLVKKFHGAKPFSYQESAFIPFDDVNKIVSDLNVISPKSFKVDSKMEVNDNADDSIVLPDQDFLH